MGSIKGLKSVVICVLVLGIVLEQVQVEGKSCCKDTMARNCYNVCRIPGTPRPVCATTCRCKIISGNKCPKDYPKLHGDPDAGTPNAIEFCNMGCMSSICDNMNNAYNVEDKEIDVELCGNACTSFCNQIIARASVAA
uniref:Uncharacterized protein n=1 Tax=Avena sativa TaxID=4498 RepID=A0ACD5YY47_AVESA